MSRAGAKKRGGSSATPTKAPARAGGVGARRFARQAQRVRQREVHRRPTRSSRRFVSPLLELLRRIPRVAWLCALVACVNGVCWSVITPPFESPDEPEHIAYVRQLAETASLPTKRGEFSAEERAALVDLRLQRVARQPQNLAISSRAQNAKLAHDLALAEESGEGGSYAGVAAGQPPLYYALEAIPFLLGSPGTLLDRIELMRLLSALMGGLTALFTYLFVREALPREPWAWLVGGLGVALVPLLGFMSGSVNPDAMLYAVTAAVLYWLARSFRHGFTRRRAVTLGVLTAVGFLTKLNFVGIAPGVILGLVVLAVRAARICGRDAYRWLAIALAIALSPVALYLVDHIASGGAAFGIVSSAVDTTRGSVWDVLNYIWQLYLPRLPGTHNDFVGVSSTRQLWFNGYVGLYGWLDTTFPGWVYELALIPTVAIIGLCARTLLAAASRLRARLPELVVYGVIALGLMVLIGMDSYRTFPIYDAEYAQARYLLPLVPLLGLVLALAARGAGRRWGPAVGAAIVMLFLAHDIFSQLQSVARFYG